MNSKKDSAGMFKKLVQARSKDATSSQELEDFSVPGENQPKQQSEKLDIVWRGGEKRRSTYN